MNDDILHLLGIASHAVPGARVNWFPWTDEGHQRLGWRGQIYDTDEELFVYLVPSLDSPVPTIGLFMGRSGNPRYDNFVGRITPQGLDDE